MEVCKDTSSIIANYWATGKCKHGKLSEKQQKTH